jgi:hypothetical protein
MIRSTGSSSRRVPWAAVARLGQIHWFFGNLYEGIVDMPQLLANAQPNRAPGLLSAGSPVRYYIPAAPLTLAATAATLINSWRSGGDRRAIIIAATSTASATALTAHLIRTVNLRLLQSKEPMSTAEYSRLVKTWHRGNLVRLLALAVAASSVQRTGRPRITSSVATQDHD